MKKPKAPKFIEIIVLDTLGVTLMIAAILTGWLPGPGGIPLFIIGLSLLAINHEWAKRHIERVQDYVQRANDFVFTNDKRVQLAYDVICPPFMALGIWLLWMHERPWQITLGLFLLFGGAVILVGNRKRIQRIKKRLRNK